MHAERFSFLFLFVFLVLVFPRSEFRTADPGGEVVGVFGKVEYDHQHY